VKTEAGGAVTRLRDVARLELGASEYALRSLLDNKPAVALPIFAAPNSNAIQISDEVRRTMAEIKQSMPEGVDYQIVYDPTQFVRASIKSVVRTLFEAIALVVLVVILFLQTWRASVIPLVAVPVSVVGTFAILYLLGFLDQQPHALRARAFHRDRGGRRIVVVENVERNIEAGLSPRDATYRAMREVSGPIIAIALVLVAVFIPLAFVSGLTGQFYRQFAVTISISTVISAINSLTLSPALSALLLRGRHSREGGNPILGSRLRGGDALAAFFAAFNKAFGHGTQAYTGGVRKALGRKAVMLGVYAVLAVATAGIFKAVPGGFVPTQDKQYLIGFAQLPDGATLDRTEDVIRRMGEIAMKHPASSTRSRSRPFDQRVHEQLERGNRLRDAQALRRAPRSSLSGGAIAGKLNQDFGAIQEAFMAIFPPPPVQGLGTTGGFKLQIEDRASLGYEALDAAMKDFMGKAWQAPELAGCSRATR
jgi:multidrug efflux pump